MSNIHQRFCFGSFSMWYSISCLLVAANVVPTHGGDPEEVPWCRWARHRLGILRCSRKYLDIPHRVLLYKSLICSFIDFGDTIYTTSSSENLRRLQVLQNTACRIILQRDNHSPTFQLHIDLNMLPLNLRRHIRIVCECYKAVNDENHCSNDFFIPVVRVTGPRTRGVSNSLMNIPKCKTVTGQKGFSVRGPKIWNSVPLEFQSIASYDVFKESYSKYVHDKFVRGESDDFPT